jgi:GT2 family glycosyltransferase
MTPQCISVVVPSYNPRPEHLRALHDALVSQTWPHFEVVVVDDASSVADYAVLTDPRFRVVRQERNRGPAAARNRGAAEARHDRLFFTDTDCTPAPDCLEHVAALLAVDAIATGDTRTRVETLFGRCVALLGFPGGGALGFHRVWRVDASGYTRSFSSCNLAIRRTTFEALGGFNETFPVAGGEDTVLARLAAERGIGIRYDPEQVVWHVEKPDLVGFIRWQIVRGRGNYYIKRHVPEVSGYLKLRVWTYKNSIASAGPLLALPVTSLWVLSVVFQGIGYRLEAQKRRVGLAPPT